MEKSTDKTNKLFYLLINVLLFEFSTPFTTTHTMYINCTWGFKRLSLESLSNFNNIQKKLIISVMFFEFYFILFTHAILNPQSCMFSVFEKIYPKSNREITENKITIEIFWKIFKTTTKILQHIHTHNKLNTYT